MSTPSRQRGESPLNRQLGVKPLLGAVLLVLIYVWSSASLGISPGKFTSAQTWRNMSDLVIRMGPYYRVTSCEDATTLWGSGEPLSGKPDPGKVKAVCENQATFYWYRSEYLQEQIQYTRDIWDPLMQTFRMAVLGAFIGALLAVPFSLMAARNLIKSKLLYYAVRTLLNLLRTIPELVLAAVLGGMLGLGALPGVGALIIFSWAIVAKLLSESVEAIDPGPLEAMQACGANKLQQIAYGVVPQVLPQFLAYTLYVLEVDVRASTVLGLVGAGGIGQLLMTNLNLFKYRNVGAVLVMMLVAVIIIDFVSTKLRERLI